MEEKIKFIKTSIIEILDGDAAESFDETTDLGDIGLNSLSFVSLVVKLEDVYNCEFDEELLWDHFKNIKEIAAYLSTIENV